MEKFTTEEFVALMRFAFECGQISGKYADASPGHLEKVQPKKFYRTFEDWLEKEVIQDPALKQKLPPSKKPAPGEKTNCPSCLSGILKEHNATQWRCWTCGNIFSRT